MFLAYLTSLAVLVDLAAACKYVEMVSGTISDKALSNGIQFKLKAVPETPVTIFLESPDLDFNVCGLTFNKDDYQTFQTVQAHVKPTFHDVSTPVRDTFIKIGWGLDDKAHCMFEVKMEQSPSAICVASGDPHVQVGRFHCV
jgi:hypothetical protein